MPRVDVSFKKTTRDMKLYLAVTSEEEKSDFIKNALEFYLKYKDLVDLAMLKGESR